MQRLVVYRRLRYLSQLTVIYVKESGVRLGSISFVKIFWHYQASGESVRTW